MSNQELIVASRNGNIEMVRELLQKEDIDVNYRDAYGDAYGYNALIWASTSKHDRTEIVKLLLQRKDIDVNYIGDIFGDRYTALIYMKNNIEIVKLLLNRKDIDVNYANNNGNTALIMASKENHIEIVKLLLQREDIKINHSDKNGNTALMWASFKGNTEIVKLLLKKEDIDINHVDNDGDNALMLALYYYDALMILESFFNNTDTVKLLLNTGRSNPLHKNKKGETIADSLDKPSELKNLLLKHEAYEYYVLLLDLYVNYEKYEISSDVSLQIKTFMNSLIGLLPDLVNEIIKITVQNIYHLELNDDSLFELYVNNIDYIVQSNKIIY